MCDAVSVFFFGYMLYLCDPFCVALVPPLLIPSDFDGSHFFLPSSILSFRIQFSSFPSYALCQFCLNYRFDVMKRRSKPSNAHTLAPTHQIHIKLFVYGLCNRFVLISLAVVIFAVGHDMKQLPTPSPRHVVVVATHYSVGWRIIFIYLHMLCCQKCSFSHLLRDSNEALRLRFREMRKKRERGTVVK